MPDAGIGESTSLARLLGGVARLVPNRVQEAVGTHLDPEEGEAVLELLADEDCRCVLAATAETPRTVPELERVCDIARSTVYRKVGELTEHGLLEERLRVEGSGPHPNEYVRAVGEVVVSLGTSVTVEARPATTADGTVNDAGDEQTPPRLESIPNTSGDQHLVRLPGRGQRYGHGSEESSRND
jgi:DNA-binding transcriptional ArsR family regulator